MIITNTSGTSIYVNGYNLIPGVPVEIPNGVYLGNSTLKNQLDSLYTQGRVHGQDPDELVTFPSEAETDELPENIYIDENSIEVHEEGDLTALMGFEETEEGDTYGVLQLRSSSESEVKLQSFTADEEDAYITISKVEGENGKFFKLQSNGLQNTLDPSTAEAEDIVNVLIELGLVVEPG